MQLDNEFTVSVPIEQAWEVLTDLEAIAPCMPGAQLTGVNDGVYTGKVKIKVGPVTAEYAGTAQFSEKDDTAYRAVIDARGRDSRGQGNATALISAQLQSQGTSTVVTVHTDLSIAGRIAQFGSGMIKEVSAKLLTQFVQCLEQKLNASGAAATADGGAEPAEPATDDTGTAAANGAAAGPASAAVTGSTAASASPEPAALNLMSVAGGAVYKRILPLVAAIVIIVVIIILVVR